MSAIGVRGFSLGLVGTGLVAMWLAGTRPTEAGREPPARAQAPIRAAPLRSVAVSDSIRHAIVDHDLFRLERRPASRRYDPTVVTGGTDAAGATPPVHLRPLLTLVGLLDGPEPAAVILGLPGVDGPRVVAVGDTAGGLRVRSITNTHVVIAGPDTTWVLSMWEPWK